MNNEYYNNKYNAQESSVIFWEDILEKLSERDKEIFRIENNAQKQNKKLTTRLELINKIKKSGNKFFHLMFS